MATLCKTANIKLNVVILDKIVTQHDIYTKPDLFTFVSWD